jgi:cytochrome c oxidase assembly factor CtaG
MAPGYVFFWTLLRVDPVPKEYPYGVGMWITAAEVVGDAFFGIAVIATPGLIAGAHYAAVGWPYGPSLAVNQVIGGGIIWILGDAVGLPFLAVQLIQMMRADRVEAAAIDAELDAKDAARAARKQAREAARAARNAWRAGEDYDPVAAVGATEADPDQEAADDTERPWWVDDPRFNGRLRQGIDPGQ